MDEPVLCSCGRLLHYNDPTVRTVVEKMIAKFGPLTTITIGDRSWRVPRHYIALHGLNGWELPTLAVRYGWIELPKTPMSTPQPDNKNAS